MSLTRFKYPYSYDTIFLPTVTANNNLIVSGSSSINGALTVIGLTTLNNTSISTLGVTTLNVLGTSTLALLNLSNQITATNSTTTSRHIHTFQSTGGAVFSIRSHGASYTETLFGNSMSGNTLLTTTTGNLIIGNFTAGDLILGTNNAQRLRIDSAGAFTISGATDVTTASSSVLIGTDSGGSISLGRRDNSATSPYLDFNTGSTTVDYDVRMQATGGTGTIGQGTLTITGSQTKFAIGLLEAATVSATAANTTVTYDFITNRNVLYYTSAATANWTLNVRGNSTTTLNSIMDIGQSLTIVFLNTNTATAYRQTGFQIDGSAITPKWVNGTVPAAGNANSIDAWTVTIIKTAASTYTVLESLTRYA